jgi:hypothetical protein
MPHGEAVDLSQKFEKSDGAEDRTSGCVFVSRLKTQGYEVMEVRQQLEDDRVVLHHLMVSLMCFAPSCSKTV